jgi:membrane-associated protease RseP (regulator of RpoE activity)
MNTERGSQLRQLTLLALVAIICVIRFGWLIPAVVLAVMAMVVAHEFGHFITAKWTGMKATEFFVGFGPRVWSFRRGETEFGLKALPLGGYVRIIGMSSLEHLDDADEPRSYRAQSYPRRLLVASAGSLMHFALAFVILACALSFIGLPDEHRLGVAGLAQWDHQRTPAMIAHLKAGDEIVGVNGVNHPSATQFSHIVHGSIGRAVELRLLAQGHIRRVSIIPVDGRTVTISAQHIIDPKGPAEGFVGVELENLTSRQNPFVALGMSAKQTASLISQAAASLPHVFSPTQLSSLFHDATNSQAAQSSSTSGNRPVSGYGIVRLAVQSAQAGPREFLGIFAMINVFVGVMNLIPMLPLDGGLIAVATYERLRTRKGQPRYQADLNKLTPVVYGFLALLAFIFITTLYLDIAHPIANPFR